MAEFAGWCCNDLVPHLSVKSSSYSAYPSAFVFILLLLSCCSIVSWVSVLHFSDIVTGNQLYLLVHLYLLSVSHADFKMF
jgi:hypothetical protein